MSCNKTSITVHNGYNNPTTVVFGRKVAGVTSIHDFTDTTRIILELYDAGDGSLDYTIDSATTSGIDWTDNPADGEVVFDLGGESIDAGNYQATMIVYDPDHLLGQLFVNDGETYTLEVVVV